jgi:glucose-1-phosphatase
LGAANEAMKTIIFDFGNVVAFFDHYRTLEKLRSFSPFTPQEMYAAVYASPLEDQVERGLLTPEAFLKQVREIWQLRCDIDVLQQAISDVFWANPEVHDIIAKLKPRYRIVLGSNTNAIHARQFLAQFADVLGQFDSLVMSHEVGTRKPDAAFFHHCVRHAQAEAAECVFVDDLAANIEGARAVGLHGVLYRPNEGLPEKLRTLGVHV